MVKNSPENTGETGSIPVSGRFSWRREWLPTPVFLPGDSYEQRSPAGYSPWSCKESDTTEQLTLSFFCPTQDHFKKVKYIMLKMQNPQIKSVV